MKNNSSLSQKLLGAVLIVMVGTCLLLAETTMAKESHYNKPTHLASLNGNTLLDPDELYFLLPDDADKTNYKRQIKAVKKGLYWNTNNRIKPLKGELRALVTKFYN